MTGAAIVTGAAGALGHSIASRLRQEVDRLLLVDLDANRLEPVAAALEAEYVAADLSVAQTPELIRAALENRSWSPRILVNNAGVNRDARATKMTDDNFSTVVRVDLVAPAGRARAPGAHPAPANESQGVGRKRLLQSGTG